MQKWPTDVRACKKVESEISIYFLPPKSSCSTCPNVNTQVFSRASPHDGETSIGDFRLLIDELYKASCMYVEKWMTVSSYIDSGMPDDRDAIYVVFRRVKTTVFIFREHFLVKMLSYIYYKNYASF
jgi:hypothetical protein